MSDEVSGPAAQRVVRGGTFCGPEGATAMFASGRAAACTRNPDKPGQARWRTNGPPARRTTRPAQAAAVVVLSTPPAAAPAPPTWDELGQPKGAAPVGQIIGHEGGTYERLPGDPIRYRVINAVGKDISDRVFTWPGRKQMAADARTELRMDAYERGRREKAHASGSVEKWDAIPGSWSYADRSISGFPGASPAEQTQILQAVDRWTGHKSTVYDATRMSEATVNAALRGAAPIDDEVRADIAALDRALDLSQTTAPMEVFRGVSNGSHIMPAGWLGKDLTGVTWTTGGYTSFTGNREAAEAYAGGEEDCGFIMRMTLPQGSSAIAIRDEPGGDDDEGEIVLPRELTFRVVRDTGPQGEYGIRAVEVELVSQP